jgi:hypothetical protein
MTIGQAYTDVLTPRAQEVLSEACHLLIDQCLDALQIIKEPEDIAYTILSVILPERYTYKYTPLFFRQFAVCVITVVWKLGQPVHRRLSSVAEELAAWAIVNQAKSLVENEEGGEEIEDTLDDFRKIYFEDLDFLFLFEDEYDGIDETSVAPLLGMFSLTFDDWLKPFSDEPEWIAHPYVSS